MCRIFKTRSAIASARKGGFVGVGGAAAATPMRSSSIARQAVRSFATETPKPAQQAAQAAQAAGSSNIPLILALGGVGGLGAWYYMGGFGDQKPGGGAPVPTALGRGALNPKEFLEFTLKEIKPYNHDSSTFVFELPDNLPPGLTVASAVVVKGAGEGVKDKEGKPVIRPYTPTTSPETTGHIDFLIKKYQNGLMTSHIHGLKPGDKLAIKGPIEKFQYKPNTFETIACIAGGSGITPMWQVMQSIAENPADKTKCTLIYTNKTDKDILLREEFDKLAKNDSRFTIIYGLDKKPSSFGKEHFEGYVTPEILSKNLPAPALADKIKIFVCGPPPQVEAISGGKGPKGSQGDLKGLLADQGYQPDQVYKF